METIMNKHKLERYSEYKDSGEGWLGEVPKHWNIYPGLRVFKENKKSNKGLIENRVLSLSYGNIIIKPIEKLTGLVPESFETYQIVEPNNIIIRGTDLQNDKKSLRTGLANHRGIITSAYLNLGVLANSSAKYLHYFLHSLDTSKALYKFGTGLRQNLSFGDFKRMPITCPPLEEQTRIANFLDDKTAKIDQAIQQKEQLIQLLKERKQIIIQNAVTRGLSPDVTMKDSGVDWIGEIPEDWEVKRLKNLIKDLESGVSVNASESESASKNEKGVLKTSCVYNYSFNPLENKRVFKSDLNRVGCPVRKNTIIISRMNAPSLVGASGYVDKDYDNLFLPDRLWQTVFYKEKEVDVLWLSTVLTTIGLREKISSVAIGSSPSMKNISKGKFLNLSIPFPNYKEQVKIKEYVLLISEKIEKAINLQTQQIKKLKEYKQVLINEVVTGKVKV